MRLLALVGFLACGSALAQYQTTRSQSWTMSVTANPPLTATVGCIGGVQAIRGFQLDSVKKFRATVQLGSAGSLTGGYLLASYYDPFVGAWAPDYQRPLYINGGAALELLVPVVDHLALGCVYFTPVNLTFSGSSTTINVFVTGVTQ